MKSAFCRRHPVVNILYFAAVIVFSMLFNHPVFMAISLFAALITALRLRGRKVLKLFFGALLPLLVFVTAVNTLFSHYGVTVLYTFSNGNSITLEAIAYGAVTGTLVVTMLLWFVCFNEVVTEDKFMHVFGKFSPHLALLVLMVLRFVPLYSKQLTLTLNARRSAGVTDKKTRFSKLRAGTAAISGVITWALEHSIETADSMKARGYGLRGRTSYSRFTFSPSDAVMIVLTAAASLITLSAKLTGTADALYNPVIIISEATLAFRAFAVCYALLCLMPVIYDLAEEIRWNRLYAKI